MSVQAIYKLIIYALWAIAIGVGVMLVPHIRYHLDLKEQMRYATEYAEHTIEDPIMQYDSVVGWKHIPGKEAFIRSAYPGMDLTFKINESGFRDSHTGALPDKGERKRILGVGDSFTFGQVDFEDSWPALLDASMPEAQVINMGANGYGVDQMYLWYREDGQKLDADLVVLAVIADDLTRAFLYKWLSGYGRPRFVLNGDKLELKNVPVPKPLKKGSKNAHPLDSEDNSDLTAGMAIPPKGKEDTYLPFKIIEQFDSLVKENGSEFLLVFMPMYADLDFERWFRKGLERFTSARKIDYLDLTQIFREKLGYNKRTIIDRYVLNLFDPIDPGILLPDGHYNKKGNQLVAEAVQEWTRSRG